MPAVGQELPMGHTMQDAPPTVVLPQ
jgi:hypothetical protein